MYFIRHGQSQFNLGYELTGRDPNTPDATLTDKGFEQARRAAGQLADKHIRQIISSPYTRALQTASVIAEILNVPLQIEPLAGEKKLYSCDIGTPRSALQQAWPQLDFSVLEDENWWPSYDENNAHLSDRVKRFHTKWVGAGQDVALVSHYYFIHGVSGRGLDNAEVIFSKLK